MGKDRFHNVVKTVKRYRLKLMVYDVKKEAIAQWLQNSFRLLMPLPLTISEAAASLMEEPVSIDLGCRAIMTISTQ